LSFETLADLAKETKDRPVEEEVRLIALKTPEMHSQPCVFHHSLVLGSLHGYSPPPMDGRIPLSGGKAFRDGEKYGVSYKEAPEAEALLRWAEKKFEDVEYTFASSWRKMVQDANFQLTETDLAKMGVPVNTAKTLEDIRELVKDIVSNHKLTGCLFQTILGLFNESNHMVSIVNRWMNMKCPPLSSFAPYASYFLEVELFLLLAINKKLISAERKSNKIDISYLFYLPFCMAFVSTDKLHKKCAPLFLRKDQQFIWGSEMKESLRRTNEHFKTYPLNIREQGLNVIAPAPPVCFESEITRLYDLHCGNDWRNITSAIRFPRNHGEKDIVEYVNSKKKLLDISLDEINNLGEPSSITIERRISKGRGSWYQLPNDIDKMN
jgi:hypothetical protein